MIESDALREMITKVEQAANERPGMGTALRALAEASSAELFEDDEQHLSWDKIVGVIEQLGRALVTTALARPMHDSELDARVRRLLVEIVSITIGEGDDLNRMVAVQHEAREILDGVTH